MMSMCRLVKIKLKKQIMKIDFTKTDMAFESLIKSGTYKVLDKPLAVYTWPEHKRRWVYVIDTKSGDCFSKVGNLIGLLGCDIFLDKNTLPNI